MSLRRNVLIFHQAALGDFVLTWPLALAAARLFAQSRVIYVTHASKGALAEKVLRVEFADAEAGWHALFGDATQLSQTARTLVEGSHLVLSFVSAPQDAWSQNVSRLAPAAQQIFLQSKPPEGSDRHVTEHIADQLSPTPALQAAMVQMLRSVAQRGVSGLRENPPDSPVVIHPGGGAARKCWPAERFVALAEKLRAAGRNLRFVLGEVELEQWPAERVARLRAVADLAQPATYLELFDVISAARVYVGNDTGPTHLAAITGVPTVALFGTDPARWRPIGPRVTIVRGETLEAIAVEDVLRAIP
jgi:ADP-heptose:LPS heptosyltransferase